MLRLEDIEYTWKLLDATHPPINELSVRELDELEIAGKHPLFAVDSSGQRQILIPVPAQKLAEDTASSGVQITSRQMVDTGSLRSYVVVICRKPHLNELFSIIITEILNALADDASHPDLTAQKVLNRWRELLERAPSERPDMQTIVGVFGELWHLRNLVRINPRSVSCWYGPTEARHDFVAGNISLEVKTSLARTGRFVVIHGHEQMEPTAGGRLYLASMKVDRVEESGESLMDLVNAVTNAGGDQAVLLPLLARAGFTAYTLELCSSIRFIVKENRIYAVEGLFPRIVTDSFVQGSLPSGILKLDYTIDLTNEPPYALTDSAVETLYQELAAKVN